MWAHLSCGSGNFTYVKAKEKIISKAGWDGLGLFLFFRISLQTLCGACAGDDW